MTTIEEQLSDRQQMITQMDLEKVFGKGSKVLFEWKDLTGSLMRMGRNMTGSLMRIERN